MNIKLPTISSLPQLLPLDLASAESGVPLWLFPKHHPTHIIRIRRQGRLLLSSLSPFVWFSSRAGLPNKFASLSSDSSRPSLNVCAASLGIQSFTICVSSSGESAAVGEQSPNEMSYSRVGHIGLDEAVQVAHKRVQVCEFVRIVNNPPFVVKPGVGLNKPSTGALFRG
jgi:hypothetical protein